MKPSRLLRQLPVVLTIGSFIVLVGLMMLTNPLSNSVYIAGFFGVSLIFLLSVSRVVIDHYSLPSRAMTKAVVVSVSLVAVLMLKSAHSLQIGSIMILVLVAAGLFFYITRR